MDISDHAATRSGATAVVMSSGETLTYGELLARSDAAAQLLYHAGLRRGTAWPSCS